MRGEKEYLHLKLLFNLVVLHPGAVPASQCLDRLAYFLQTNCVFLCLSIHIKMSSFLCKSFLSYPRVKSLHSYPGVKMQVQIQYKNNVYVSTKFFLFW